MVFATRAQQHANHPMFMRQGMTYEHGKMLKGFREIQSDFFKRLESSSPVLEGESGRKARLRPLYPS